MEAFAARRVGLAAGGRPRRHGGDRRPARGLAGRGGPGRPATRPGDARDPAGGPGDPGRGRTDGAAVHQRDRQPRQRAAGGLPERRVARTATATATPPTTATPLSACSPTPTAAAASSADADAVASERRFGCMRYHPAHDHWHVLDISAYELRREPRRQALRAHAQGRLLPDRRPARLPEPGHAADLDLSDQPARIRPAASRSPTQGISPGWADAYLLAAPGPGARRHRASRAATTA